MPIIFIPKLVLFFFFLLAIPIQVLTILWFIFKKINFLQKLKQNQQPKVKKIKKIDKNKTLTPENKNQSDDEQEKGKIVRE